MDGLEGRGVILNQICPKAPPVLCDATVNNIFDKVLFLEHSVVISTG